MKDITAIKYFSLGVMIAFTISILCLSVITAIASDAAAVPVSYIWQTFILSIICSMINSVYRSENLKFIWQSLIGYILTTSAITACGLIFDWYGSIVNCSVSVNGILISVLLYSFFYLIAWLIIWQIIKSKKKLFNEKLMEYKQKQ